MKDLPLWRLCILDWGRISMANAFLYHFQMASTRDQRAQKFNKQYL